MCHIKRKLIRVFCCVQVVVSSLAFFTCIFHLPVTVSPLKSCGTQADMSVRLAVLCRGTFL